MGIKGGKVKVDRGRSNGRTIIHLPPPEIPRSTTCFSLLILSLSHLSTHLSIKYYVVVTIIISRWIWNEFHRGNSRLVIPANSRESDTGMITAGIPGNFRNPDIHFFSKWNKIMLHSLFRNFTLLIKTQSFRTKLPIMLNWWLILTLAIFFFVMNRPFNHCEVYILCQRTSSL